MAKTKPATDIIKDLYEITSVHILIGRLADLRWQAQRGKIDEIKAEEILKLLSHI